MSTAEKRPTNFFACWSGFALLSIAAVLLISIISSHLRPALGRFGDAAWGRAYATIICAALIPALVVFGQLLVCFGTRSAKYRLPGWILAGLTGLALLALAVSVAYSMRPVPTYDPQNYQHLVGQHLRDARSELDTKHSVSGAQGRNRFLSLRGMVIVTNSDGVITEVRKNSRK